MTRIPTTGTAATVTEVQGTSDQYDVHISSTAAGEPNFFTVTGLTTDRIRNLTLDCTTPQVVNLTVRGPTIASRIAEIGTIDMQSSTSTVILKELRASGNVGGISINILELGDILGNITGDIIMLPRNGGGTSNIESLTVGGSILDEITVNHGHIQTLAVAGDIGQPGTPVPVSVRDHIANISARAIYADITADPTIDSSHGLVHRVVTTGGSFVGSLSARTFTNAVGPGAPVRRIHRMPSNIRR